MAQPRSPPGRRGAGGGQAFPGLCLQGVPGLLTWSSQARAQEGLRSQVPGCLAPNPETPFLGPLPTSYLLPNPISWPSPTPPVCTSSYPILLSSSPGTESKDRQTSGRPEAQAHLPPGNLCSPHPVSTGHSLAWNRVRFWAGPQREWAVGASWPHLAICQVGVGMGLVPGTGDTAVTETGRDSAHSRPVQEGPSPESSTVTSTGSH